MPAPRQWRAISHLISDAPSTDLGFTIASPSNFGDTALARTLAANKHEVVTLERGGRRLSGPLRGPGLAAAAL